jgi:hypothetical protein
MKPFAHLVWLLVISAATVSAEELPASPSAARNTLTPLVAAAVVPPTQSTPPILQPVRLLDKKFLSLAIISTASIFADSYTTIWAGQNWRAGKQNVCNVESESPYLYGLHPTAVRSYLVGAGKSVGTVALSYYLRKHHSRFWSLPFIATSGFSLEGASHNLVICN